MAQGTFAPDALVKICLEESVRDAQCIVVTQLKEKLTVIILYSITVLADHTLLHLSVVSNVCTEISPEWSHSLALILCRESLIFFTNLGTAGALEFGLFSCVEHRKRSINFSLNMHTLPPSRIHSSTQRATCGLTVTPTSLGRQCCLNTGVWKIVMPTLSSIVL